MTTTRTMSLLALLCLLYVSIVSANVTSFSHRLVLYECDSDSIIYKFQYGSPNAKPVLEGPIDPPNSFSLRQVKKQHEVTVVDKLSLNLNRKFQFRVKTNKLIVEVTGEVRPCEQPSSTKCTILISVLASVSLLLFAALALSLIVLKERRVPCWHKLSTWLRSKAESNSPSDNGPTAPDGIDLEHLNRIYENGIKSEPVIDDSPPIIPTNVPRKSSLKPPRTEAFSVAISPDTEVSIIDPGPFRRKSIVTFNERTEIRS